MATIDNIHTYGWYGTFERDDDGKCIPCETLSLYEDDGKLKAWATGIVQIEQYRSVIRMAWTSTEDERIRKNWMTNYGPGGILEALPDEVKPSLLDALEDGQLISELRCGTPYVIVKKESTPKKWPPVSIDGFVPANKRTKDAGRLVECENCPEALECIC